MDKKKRITAIATTVLLLFFFTFNFNGCSKDNPLSPTTNNAPDSRLMALTKNNGNSKSIRPTTDETSKDMAIGKIKRREKSNLYPQYAEKTLIFDIETGAYKGGTMRVDNGTQFHVYDASFIPPEGTPEGENVIITMKVEKIRPGKNEQLIFTFGPSGSQFVPAGVIRMCWKDISGSEPPDFYYIDEQGNYILQRPEYVDNKNKNIYAHIEHFSRYALAHAE